MSTLLMMVAQALAAQIARGGAPVAAAVALSAVVILAAVRLALAGSPAWIRLPVVLGVDAAGMLIGATVAVTLLGWQLSAMMAQASGALGLGAAGGDPFALLSSSLGF